MANFQIFASKNKTTVNHAGGAAYQLTPEQQLAQLAVTGCFNQTFYASGGEQVEQVLALSWQVSPEFLAKTAIFAREKGYMKDMPALLLAILASRDVHWFTAAFPRVVNNGKMLRNFVQMVRSGVTGRKSLGSRPKRLVQNWLRHASEKQLLAATVGTRPSLQDVVKMVHPKPYFPWHEAWFGWLLRRPYDFGQLPPLTAEFEAYKYQKEGKVPDVPFQMLTALDLGRQEWTEIALQGSWQMVRQNLNTFARHGVFSDPKVTQKIAEKLSDAQTIRAAKAFPYQLMSAYFACSADVPAEIRLALELAMEIALENVPTLAGNVAIGVDVSGSMGSAITGYRRGATSSMTCVQVAALAAAALLKKNPDAYLLPFDTKVHHHQWATDKESIFELAERLARFCGGGTAVSAPVKWLNQKNAEIETMIIISDNESWADRERSGSSTALMQAWEKLKKRCPAAKLVCIDLQPYGTAQVTNREDILNIGGFSDNVFQLLASFANKKNFSNGWVKAIEAVYVGFEG